MPSSLSRNSVIQSKFSSFMLLIAVYVVIISGTRYSVVDDAYISFRYAYQLANHGTLFFNLGEPVG